MLRDQDRRTKRCRQSAQQVGQRMQPPRRGTDRETGDPAAHQGPERQVGRILARRLADRLRFAGMTDADELLGKDFGEATPESAGARLGERVSSAERHRLDRGCGALFGGGGDDQHAGAAAGVDQRGHG